MESGGGSEYEYFALTDGWAVDIGLITIYYSSLIKAQTAQLGIVIAPALIAKVVNNNEEVDPIAVAIDMSLLVGVSGQQMTIKDSILVAGITEESLAKYRITKEEFYNIE